MGIFMPKMWITLWVDVEKSLWVGRSFKMEPYI